VIRAASSSLLAHLILVVVLFNLSLFDAGTQGRTARLPDLRKATPLVLPPAEPTQPVPNKGKINREFTADSLVARLRIFLPPSPPSTTRPAPAAPPVLSMEPPKIEGPEIARQAPPPGGPLGLPQPPLPAPPPEKPKLAFESVTAQGMGRTQGPGTGDVKVPVPGKTVDDAMRSVIRTGRVGGVMVGDSVEGPGGFGEGLDLPPSPGRVGSSLELLSDPQGVDFRPYLIRVLSAVRRNWFAVMPESAKLGRRGRTTVQFAISRDGRVPKLVISVPSGADALDRAAVAGISASNPFPPLPGEFRGDQIRLQLVFLYNMRN
jgi:TonB family protein